MDNIRAEIMLPVDNKYFVKVGINGLRSQNIINCFDIEEAETICSRINTDPLKIIEEMYQEHEYALVKGFGENDAEPEPKPKWDIATLEEVLKRLKEEK